jgi:Uma2 family endonuclease
MSAIIGDIPPTTVSSPLAISPPSAGSPTQESSAHPNYEPDIQRFIVPSVDWASYIQISDGIGERHIRVTYDGKEVEFMSLSKGHESWSRVIERLIGELCTEMGTDYVPCGSATLRRHDVTRGIEPDNSFYIANAAAVKNVSRLDLNKQPSPDLVVEVEISRSVLDRIGIYEALGVRELWRANEAGLHVFLLGDDRHFHESPTSQSFPNISIEQFQEFVKEANGNITGELIRRFREWVQNRLR